MNPKNVLAEFSRAQKSLQAAKLLQADGLFEDAVSRAYYAVMHAAKAALLIHDRLAESHVAIRRYFGSVLVRAGRIEKEWAGILAREHDRRVAADYNANLLMDAESSFLSCGGGDARQPAEARRSGPRLAVACGSYQGGAGLLPAVSGRD